MRRSRSRRVKDALLGYALVLPSLVVFGIFIFYPFAKNFSLALYRTPPFPGLPKKYVGLDQVGDVLSSSSFHKSLRVTVEFVLLTVPTGIVLGLLLAVLAHKQLRGMGAYRTIFSSTVATSVAAASVIFFTLLNPQVGLLTYWLGRSGETGVLEDPKTALLAVAVTTIWQNIGLSFILMSAGLQGVPDELYEAAEVDGANGPRRFWHVTLPMLSPYIFFNLVMGIIGTLQIFAQAFIMTQGGPNDSTLFYAYYLFNNAFRYFKMGYASALAWLLFACIGVFVFLQMRVFRSRRVYDE